MLTKAVDVISVNAGTIISLDEIFRDNSDWPKQNLGNLYHAPEPWTVQVNFQISDGVTIPNQVCPQLADSGKTPRY